MVFYHARMRHRNAFGHIILTVSLFVKSFELVSSFFGKQVRLQLVYKGHRLKVKVTGAIKPVCVCCSRVDCLRLKGNLVLSVFVTA